jgi:glutathione S-transferase
MKVDPDPSSVFDNLLSLPDSRAFVRLQADHINRTLIPAFYASLMAQDPETLSKRMQAFTTAIEGFISLFERAEKEQATKTVLGLWAENGEIGWADVMAVPWLHRADVVLRYYKGFEFPSDQRWAAYLHRLLNHPAVKKTTSDHHLYVDSYEG